MSDTNRPAPPADGADGPSIKQLGTLIAWLTEQCCQAADAGRSVDAGMLLWAAQVVEERVDEDAPDSTPPAEGEDLATSLQNCGTWLIEIGYASEQVNTRDMGIKVARAAALLQQQAAELAMLRQLARPVAIPGEAYEIDMGDVMWWRFPIDEPPWLGTPGDSDWPGYHTHFTPCPAEPVLPLPSEEEVA